jgi:hypothetical protein
MALNGKVPDRVYEPIAQDEKCRSTIRRSVVVLRDGNYVVVLQEAPICGSKWPYCSCLCPHLKDQRPRSAWCFVFAEALMDDDLPLANRFLRCSKCVASTAGAEEI